MSPKTHEVIDHQTGAVVGTYSSLKRAHHAADQRDLEYGAVRYGVRRIETPTGTDSPYDQRDCGDAAEWDSPGVRT